MYVEVNKGEQQKLTVKVFNTEVVVPIFQSEVKTKELLEKLENHMLEVYKEYQVLQTQMIAIRTAYDFLVALELLNEELERFRKNTFDALNQLNFRINKIASELGDVS